MTRPDPAPPEAAVALYALTRRGADLILALGPGLKAAAIFMPRRLEPEYGRQAEYFTSLAEALGGNFQRFDGHVVVGAAGMVVRLIAPHLKGKKEDPAVVVLPQDGRFAISLLSGHLGGGNDLARRVAELTGGQAVISTATDVEQFPALEVLARDSGLVITDFTRLPGVSRKLVDGERVTVEDPHGFFLPRLAPWAGHFTPAQSGSRPDVRVDFHLRPDDGQMLTLRPPAIALGLGCHRGIDPSEVEELIARCLAQAELARDSIAVLATVETRAEEPAFVELSRRLKKPLMIFTKAELDRVVTPNPSDKVRERIGVASVCEAAAMLAARTERLIIKKQKSGRATLAAALCQ